MQTECIENAFRDMLREDARFFDKIPPEKLTDTLLSEHNYTNEHLEILSELFFAQAELFLAKEQKNKSLLYYEKSLLLLKFATNESDSFSFSRQSRLLQIEKKIDEL